MDTKVTVIVPAYNEEQTIQRCMESLIDQTVTPNIIVVNDGSTDKTSEKLMKYSNLNNFLLINQTNQGASAARNRGIKAAKTELITFVDADDYVEDNFIKVLLDGYLKHKNIDLSVCNYSINKQHSNSCGNFRSGVVNRVEYFNSLISDGGVNGFVYNKMFRKSIIEKYNIWFDKHIAIGEDFLFCFLYGGHCNKIIFNNSITIHYLPTSQGISDTMQIKGHFSNKIFDYFFANIKIINFLTSLNTSNNKYIESIINKEIYRTSIAATTIIRKVYLYQEQKYLHDLRQLKDFLRNNLKIIMKNKNISIGDKIKIFMSIYFPILLKQIDMKKING